MKIYNSVDELVGRTPLLDLKNYARENALSSRILAKLEYLNPTGSIKDRAALSMILDAETRGLLKPGATIIEPTSGNTGIGLAAIGTARGYRVMLTMPDSMSEERRAMLRAYGAELVLTPGAEGMNGAIKKANELKDEISGSFIPNQFENAANPAIHEKTTGVEIFEDTDGAVDIVVAGVGSGGTVTGISHYLKAKKPSVQIIAVEPSDSAVLSGEKSGAHKLQGIGAGFVPKALDTESYDAVMKISADEAYSAVCDVARLDGVLLGISSGAAIAAARKLAAISDNAGKTIVAIAPDTGTRYLSTPDLF